MAQSYEKHLQLSYKIVRKRTGIALFSLPLHKIGCGLAIKATIFSKQVNKTEMSCKQAQLSLLKLPSAADIMKCLTNLYFT